jgi:hypothetical protein
MYPQPAHFRGGVPARKFLRIVLASVAVAGMIAACGQGNSPSVVTLRTQGAASSSPGLTSAQSAIAYTTCMREHGVDLPDPTMGPAGSLTVSDESSLAKGKFDKGTFAEANDACRHFLTDAAATGSPGSDTAQRDAALAYARCMRDHGIDMPDPVFVNGAIPAGLDPNIDPTTPEFVAADQACIPLLNAGQPDSSGSPKPGSK